MLNTRITTLRAALLARDLGVDAVYHLTPCRLDALAAGDRSVVALKGWRGEVFGADALRLCKGEIALSAKGGAVRVVSV